MGTVQIPLGGNKGYFLIDEQDVPFVSQHRWYCNQRKQTAYACTTVRVDGKWRGVRLHRLLLNAPPDKDVHHINGNGLDNRRANLCLIDPHEHRKLNSRPGTGMVKRNSAAKRKRAPTSGVWYDKKIRKWRAHIRVPVGSFTDLDSALRARDATIKALGLDTHGIR